MLPTSIHAQLNLSNTTITILLNMNNKHHYHYTLNSSLNPRWNPHAHSFNKLPRYHHHSGISKILYQWTRNQE